MPLVSFGQDYGNKADALKLCTAIQSSSFISDSKADNALDRILSVIGASKRFVLQPCDNINNALATSYKGIRYIFYDRDFMDSLDSGDNWSNLFILAHEVGHHINGHSLDIILYANDIVDPKSLVEKRKQELEADEFAGFILGKLGATLEQTSLSINLISVEKDDTYDTHPSKSKRLTSIEIGYNKALGKEKVIYEIPTNLQTAEEYYYKAENKIKKGYFRLAIKDLNKAIELNPDNEWYYISKANTKVSINEDVYGAIADLNKAIDLNPNNSLIYIVRASAKGLLNDLNGLIKDVNKGIELNPNDGYPYYLRALGKKELKEYDAAIADFSKAIEIDPNNTEAYYSRGLSKYHLKDYYGAISDFSKAIDLNPNEFYYYQYRAVCKKSLNDFNGAIADFNKAIELNPNDTNSYFGRGQSKSGLKDEYGAIEDYNKTIEIDPNYAKAHYNKGVIKYYLGDKNGACQDGRIAQSLGYDASQLINNACN